MTLKKNKSKNTAPGKKKKFWQNKNDRKKFKLLVSSVSIDDVIEMALDGEFDPEFVAEESEIEG